MTQQEEASRDWKPTAMTGVGAVVRSGSPPLPSAVGWVPTDSEPMAWQRPEEIWSEARHLFVVEGITVMDDDGVPSEHSFGLPTPEPSPSVLEEFITIAGEQDVLRLAASWGPLGICSCSWSGQPARWQRELHPAHLIKVEKTPIGKSHGGHWSRTLVRQELIDTWVQLARRAGAFIDLFNGFGGVTKPENSTPARILGLAWPAAEDIRRAQVGRAMTAWARLGNIGPQFEMLPDGPLMGLQAAPGFLGWITMQVLLSAGTFGSAQRFCRNCGTLFPYGRLRHYCERCSSSKVAERDASRRYRANRGSAIPPRGTDPRG